MRFVVLRHRERRSNGHCLHQTTGVVAIVKVPRNAPRNGSKLLETTKVVVEVGLRNLAREIADDSELYSCRAMNRVIVRSQHAIPIEAAQINSSEFERVSGIVTKGPDSSEIRNRVQLSGPLVGVVYRSEERRVG